MRILGLIAAASALLAACGSREREPAPAPGNDSSAAPAAGEAPAASVPAAAAPLPAPPAGTQSSGEGVALALRAGIRAAAIRLHCPAGRRAFWSTFPASADRKRGAAVVRRRRRLRRLVADVRGDKHRGGVSGTGAVPANLAALIGGPVSAATAPSTAAPIPLRRAPLPAIRRRLPRRLGPRFPAAGRLALGRPCLVQDGKPVRVAKLLALGTEPFWAARVEGRCVTYSHPEDQKGVRSGPALHPARAAGTWSGAWAGAVRAEDPPQRGCSDGMSDKSFPLAADIVVEGERRSGCAEPD